MLGVVKKTFLSISKSIILYGKYKYLPYVVLVNQLQCDQVLKLTVNFSQSKFSPSALSLFFKTFL